MARTSHERLSFAPIEAVASARSKATTDVARVLDVDRSKIYVWRMNGLTYERADELAVRLGRHPAELWPDDW